MPVKSPSRYVGFLMFSKKETRAYLILNLTMIKMLTVWCYDRSGKLKIWDLL